MMVYFSTQYSYGKEVFDMEEKFVKEICKLRVDHGRYHYSEFQKFAFKQAIDASRTPGKLFCIMLMIG